MKLVREIPGLHALQHQHSHYIVELAAFPLLVPLQCVSLIVQRDPCCDAHLNWISGENVFGLQLSGALRSHVPLLLLVG